MWAHNLPKLNMADSMRERPSHNSPGCYWQLDCVTSDFLEPRRKTGKTKSKERFFAVERVITRRSIRGKV